MSARAYRVYRPYRYRPAPIEAAFAPSHCNVNPCLQSARTIGNGRPANDPLKKGIAPMADIIVTSYHRATIQIPIAMQSTLATTQHPAVSSLKAYLTPAR